MLKANDHSFTGENESFRTIVIGGGQAGLAVGYYLAQQGEDFIILDKDLNCGDAWRNRWDSLRLFTPSQIDSLPGMPFPKPDNYFPLKDEVANYLDEYAGYFNLPIRHEIKVENLSRNGQGYQILAGDTHYAARNVVVATGMYQIPFTPKFSNQLDLDIFQLHASAYRNPQQIPSNSVLVVGAGNSGAEIALELSRSGKQVWLSGRDVGSIPLNSPLGKIFDGRLAWWFMTHILTVDTPIGRKMQASLGHHGAPLGHAHRNEIAAAGINLSPRMAGVQSGKPELENGQILSVEGIIWATGFQPDYGWIDLPIVDQHGYPIHSRGVIQNFPGLYFVGLLFQSGLTSSLLGGVGKDAADIAARVLQNNL